MTGRRIAPALLLAGAVLACSSRQERSAPPDTANAPASPDTTDPAAAIRRYYDAISHHDYRTAYLVWGDSGRASGQSFDAFRDGFAGTDSVRVTIGEAGRIEGAAGSRFTDVPVTVDAWTSSGQVQHFTGRYTLRRVVVDGATAEQRRWHFYSAELHR